MAIEIKHSLEEMDNKVVGLNKPLKASTDEQRNYNIILALKDGTEVKADLGKAE